MAKKIKRKKKKMQRVVCFLPDDVMASLDAEAKRTGASRSKLMRRLLSFCTMPKKYLSQG